MRLIILCVIGVIGYFSINTALITKTPASSTSTTAPSSSSTTVPSSSSSSTTLTTVPSTSTTSPSSTKTPKPDPSKVREIVGDIIVGGVLGEVRDKAIESAVKKLASTKNISSIKMINALKKVLPNTVNNASKILKNVKNIMMGLKAAQAAVKMGGRISAIAAKMLVRLSLGPAGAALLLFDIINMAVDAANVGGVAKFDMSNTFDKMYKEENSELLEYAETEGYPYPIIMGPLNDIDEKSSNDILNKNIFNELTNLTDPLLAPLVELMQKYTSAYDENNPNIDYNIPMNNFQSQYPKNYAKILQNAYQKSCTELGGIYNNIYGDNCSFTKEICNNKSNDPKDSLYNKLEFIDNGGTSGQTCRFSLNTTKQACEAPYSGSNKWNSDTKICMIDPILCSNMGGDSNPNGNGKCTVPEGQLLLELIFGTTIVREIKALYDPKNFEPCKSGAYDDGYFCRTLQCQDGLVETDGFCYKPCPPKYNKRIGMMCSITCPDGSHDDGAFCSYCGNDPSESYKWNRNPLTCDNNSCPSGWTQYDKKRYETYYSSRGSSKDSDFNITSCYKNCPNGMKYDLHTGLCHDNNFPVETRNMEDNATRSCPSGWQNVGDLNMGGSCTNNWDFPRPLKGPDVTCPKGMLKYDPGIGRTKCYKPCRTGYKEKLDTDEAGNKIVKCSFNDNDIEPDKISNENKTILISSIQKKDLPGMDNNVLNTTYNDGIAGIPPKISIVAKKRTDKGIAERKKKIQEARVELEKKLKEEQDKQLKAEEEERNKQIRQNLGIQ